jgi:hypothetical protein
MFDFVLNMVIALLLASVHSAAHITPKEWALIDSLQAALTALQAKKPAA